MGEVCPLLLSVIWKWKPKADSPQALHFKGHILCSQIFGSHSIVQVFWALFRVYFDDLKRSHYRFRHESQYYKKSKNRFNWIQIDIRLLLFYNLIDEGTQNGTQDTWTAKPRSILKPLSLMQEGGSLSCHGDHRTSSLWSCLL